MNNKLYKSHIISKKKEISLLFKTGIRWKNHSIKIYYKKNNNSYDRFAVIVSRKNGNSVKRNRIKRVYREFFRTNKRHFPPFFDYLFKPEQGFEEKKDEIKSTIASWFLTLEKDHYQL